MEMPFVLADISRIEGTDHTVVMRQKNCDKEKST